MKRILVITAIAAFIGVNALQISTSKNSTVNINGIIQTAQADLENEPGTCYTVDYVDTYWTYECAGGGYYEDLHIVYTCSFGNETTCIEGWESHVRYCDGTNYEDSYFGQEDCS